MENSSRAYTTRHSRLSTRTRYQAAMEVHSKISAVDSRVITRL